MITHRLALALAAATLLVVGCGGDDPTGEDSALDPNRVYIDAIVPHHQLGVAETDEAITKAVHPGLRTLAQRIKEDQMSEIALFQQQRQERFGTSETPPPGPLQPIPASPVFDSIWLANFIQHHQTAINSSQFALQGNLSGNAEELTPVVDSLARHVVDEQTREQTEFQDSITVWYGL